MGVTLCFSHSKEQHRLRAIKKGVLRRIFLHKRAEVARRWTKLHDDEFHNFRVTKYYKGDQVKEDEMGGTCIIYGRD
jgi:hypothetical protein